MTISKANKSDAEEILSVQKAAFQTEAEIHNMYDIQPLAQTLAELLKEFDLGPVLKVSHNGRIIGSARAHINDNIVTICKVVVLPEFRGRGIAKALISELENICPASRYEIYTNSKSYWNISLYKSLGYTAYGERIDSSKLTFTLLAKEK